MRISDWSSDVCSSDLGRAEGAAEILGADDHLAVDEAGGGDDEDADRTDARELIETPRRNLESPRPFAEALGRDQHKKGADRSEEHTSELQSLMRISYAVFCLKKKNHANITKYNTTSTQKNH